MKNIRHNVFETNSSSTHSISISEKANGIYDTIVPDDNGVIVLNGGEFGWAWNKYNDSLTKLNYVAIYALFQISIGNAKEDIKNLLIEVVKEHTGAKEIIFNFSTTDTEDNNYSYIDHQSTDAAKDAFYSKEYLKDFIFNPNSWLFTGNDNDIAPLNFYNVEPLHTYKYKLYLNNEKEKIFFLKKKPSNASLKDHLSDLVYRMGKKSYDLMRFNKKCVDGTKVDSFSELKNNKIILYKTKPIYSRGQDNAYVGVKVLDTKEIYFTLEKNK